MCVISGDTGEIETKPGITFLATSSRRIEIIYTSQTPSSSGSILKSSSLYSGSSLNCLGTSSSGSSLTSLNSSRQVNYVASSSCSNLSIPSSGPGSFVSVPNESPNCFNISMPYTEEEEAWINQQFQMIEDIFR